MTSLASCMFSKGQQPNCLLGKIPDTCCFHTGLTQCLRKLQQPRWLCYGQMRYGWSSPCPILVFFSITTTYLYIYLCTCIYTRGVLSMYQSLSWSSKLIQSTALPSSPACRNLSDFTQHLLVLQHESEMSVSGREQYTNWHRNTEHLKYRTIETSAHSGLWDLQVREWSSMHWEVLAPLLCTFAEKE